MQPNNIAGAIWLGFVWVLIILAVNLISVVHDIPDDTVEVCQLSLCPNEQPACMPWERSTCESMGPAIQ